MDESSATLKTASGEVFDISEEVNQLRTAVDSAASDQEKIRMVLSSLLDRPEISEPLFNIFRLMGKSFNVTNEEISSCQEFLKTEEGRKVWEKCTNKNQ